MNSFTDLLSSLAGGYAQIETAKAQQQSDVAKAQVTATAAVAAANAQAAQQAQASQLVPGLDNKLLFLGGGAVIGLIALLVVLKK